MKYDKQNRFYEFFRVYRTCRILQFPQISQQCYVLCYSIINVGVLRNTHLIAHKRSCFHRYNPVLTTRVSRKFTFKFVPCSREGNRDGLVQCYLLLTSFNKHKIKELFEFLDTQETMTQFFFLCRSRFSVLFPNLGLVENRWRCANFAWGNVAMPDLITRR